MKKIKRVEERYDCLLPVSMMLKEGVNGEKLVGPIKGVFCNISAGGAALLLDEVSAGDYHLVDSPREHPNQVLELTANGMAILSHPVWYHHISDSNQQKYRMGVSFLHAPSSDDMQKMIDAKPGYG
jgi:c-di-GMP-binding flagellar brake protein YcgR